MLMRLPPELRNQIYRSDLGAKDLRALAACSSAMRADVESLGPSGPWHKVWSERFEDDWSESICCENLNAQSNYRQIYEACALFDKISRDGEKMMSQQNCYSSWHFEEPIESNHIRMARIVLAVPRRIKQFLRRLCSA